jgi:DNA polymerase III delta subunit
MIVERLVDPVPGVFVVLVQHGGKMPSPISKFQKSAKIDVVVHEAEKLAAGAGKGSKAASVVEVELQRAMNGAGVKLDSEARARIVGHLGDDGARVHELVAVLATRFPRGATVRVADVEPYLGATGAVDSSFALTTAIEQGDAPAALELLHRLMHSTSAKRDKAQHPMQIMAIVTNYYRALLRIDDPAIVTKDDAAAALGGNPWAAKYRLDALRAIGSDGVRQAYAHVAQADLDLRGGGGKRAIDEETVMQVLVARLCAIHQRGRGRGGARTPAATNRGR